MCGGAALHTAWHGAWHMATANAWAGLGAGRNAEARGRDERKPERAPRESHVSPSAGGQGTREFQFVPSPIYVIREQRAEPSEACIKPGREPDPEYNINLF